ncbi:MAG: sodium/proline symporter [Gammaproteobacteria bacterium]|nr:sodium/proline symporter [Gammaproteobacteria bacterium]
MSENNIVIAVLLVYFCIMLGIGVWARREGQSGVGYFLAGRKLPYWVAAFSMNATGESAWLLLGLSGMAYLVGFQALWVVIGEVIGVALAWILVAKRLNKESRENNTITVPDFLSEKFQDKTHSIRIVSVVIILLMVAAYIAAQMLATGKAFNIFLGWDYTTGVWVGGLVTVAYTSFGGFKAVAYTDAVQAMLMLFALIAVPVVGLPEVGGFSGLWAGLQNIDLSLTSPWVLSDSNSVIIFAVASSLAIGLPFIGVPQLLVRFMAIKDTDEVPKAATVSVIVILMFDLGAVATGLVGRVLFPDLADPENIMPTLAKALFSPLVTGILVVAVLSAVMSTVSSLLNLASSAIVHDLYQKIRNPDSDGKHEAKLGQWTTLVLGIAGCLIAMVQEGLIFTLVLFAWSGLGAAFGPVTLCALRWKKTTRQGVVAGMIAGFGTSVLWVIFAKENFYDLYEMVPAVIMGLGATLLVSHLTWSEEVSN